MPKYQSTRYNDWGELRTRLGCYKRAIVSHSLFKTCNKLNYEIKLQVLRLLWQKVAS